MVSGGKVEYNIPNKGGLWPLFYFAEVDIDEKRSSAGKLP